MDRSNTDGPTLKKWLSAYRRLYPRLRDPYFCAVVAALPWSTSVSAVLIVIGSVGALASLDAATVRRTRITAAVTLPVLLWLLAAFGMLWADISWADRFDGLKPFYKLLLIPLVLVQYANSEKGWAVPAAYLASCSVLLGASLAFTMWPTLTWHWSHSPGVAMKDTIAQSGEFVLCALAAFAVMVEAWRRGLRLATFALAALAALFLFDVFFIATSRTALVTIPALALVLGFRLWGWKGSLAAGAGIVILAGAVWFSSPYLRGRVMDVQRELDLYANRTDPIAARTSSAGDRIAFWTKAATFIRAAPAIGHGTGSTLELFRDSAAGRVGFDALVTSNPHNQTLNVAIQLGSVGAAVLWAMWIAHLLLFRGPGLAQTLGLLVVAQNIVSSVFNSHIADFTQGWTYVFGVAVLGGMALHEIERRGGDQQKMADKEARRSAS